MLHLSQLFMVIMIVICISICCICHIIIIVSITVLVCQTITAENQWHKHKIGYVALTCGEMKVSKLAGDTHVKVLLNFRRAHSLITCSGELRTQKLKSHLVRTQSLNALPLKLGVGQYIAIRNTLTARDFFLTHFYPSGPFTCIFSKPLPISPVSAVANTWFLYRPAE